MGRSLLLAIILVTSPLAAFAVTNEPNTWELRDGRWQKVAESSTTAQTVPNDPQLDQIERLIAEKSYRSAVKDLKRWVKANRNAPQFDRGLYLMAEALYGYGDGIKSFYYCDELLDEYPDSQYFSRAIEKQYVIADAYLNGYKRRFIGIPMLGADDEAVEMLFRIQQRSPGSQLAERSLLRTADYFFKEKQWDLAGDVYGAYLKSYPRSPNGPQVKLRRAYANLFQFRGSKFDPTPVLDARQQFAELQQESPALAESEDVATLIQRIDDSLAGKLVYTAEYFQRTHEPKAASYTWRDLAQKYPNAPQADRARAAIERLPQPELMPGGSATTQPVSKAE